MSKIPWQNRCKPQWDALEVLLMQLNPSRRQRIEAKQLQQLMYLYRRVLSDLLFIKHRPQYQFLQPYLNHLAQQAHVLVHVNAAKSWQDIVSVILVDFPRAVRENLFIILVSIVIFVLGVVFATQIVVHDPSTETMFLPPSLIDGLNHGTIWTNTIQPSVAEAVKLMSNNIRVTFTAFAFGAFVGVGTVFIMLYNGIFALGGPLQVCMQHGMGFQLLRFMMAHGFIELSTIFIAGAAGTRLGLSMLFPGEMTRWESIRLKSRQSLILMAGCFWLLVIAGCIEGLVSLNGSINVYSRLSIGLGSFILLVCYISFSGREQPKKQ